MKGHSRVLLASAAASVAVGLVASCLLAGCGQREEPIPVEKSVFGDQVKQIDRAKELNKTMESRMPELNKKLDDSGG